jgi:hypothetical protein
MLRRLKRVLVESFVGAIALGYLLAQGLLHFVYIFTSPFSEWLCGPNTQPLPAKPRLCISLLWSPCRKRPEHFARYCFGMS